MLDSAESGQEVQKETFEALVPGLRVELLNAQFELGQTGRSVLVVIAGDDRPGCEAVFDLLHEWMDARRIESYAFDEPTNAEAERPRFWRYWNALPSGGAVGVHLGAWPMNAIVERVRKDLKKRGFRRRLACIRQFERTLADSGTVVVKLWLHLPEREFKTRMKRARKRPKKEWSVDDRDWKILEHYETGRPVAEGFLEETSTPQAPWTVIESTDPRHRDLQAASSVHDAIVRAVDWAPTAAPVSATATPLPPAQRALGQLDLSPALEQDVYERELEELQARMARLSRAARAAGLTTVLVFEGADAAGKGGAIRRLTHAVAARNTRVVAISAPTEEERAHHYLWRFWRRLPRAGRLLVFDRSWYGRVLVERVEGFARPDEWTRAYDEINELEEELVEYGYVLLKFWLHIDAEEQLRRFEAREKTPYKKYKITPEDYRNRRKWDAYVSAADDMFERTSTETAPWHLIAANDKRWARVAVLRMVCEALARRLN